LTRGIGRGCGGLVWWTRGEKSIRLSAETLWNIEKPSVFPSRPMGRGLTDGVL